MKDQQNIADGHKYDDKYNDSKTEDINKLKDLLSNLSIKSYKTEDKGIKKDIDKDKKEDSNEEEIKNKNLVEEDETSSNEDDVKTKEGKNTAKPTDATGECLNIGGEERNLSSDESTSDNEDAEQSKECETDALSAKISDLKVNDSEDDSCDEDESVYLKRGPLTDHKIHSYRYSPFNHQGSGNEGYPPNDGSTQSFFYYNNLDGLSPTHQHSPASQPSQNSSPYYATNFNQNSFGYQTDYSNDGCSAAPQVPDSSNFELGNNCFESYQPLTPPQSVSPHLKDGQDGYHFKVSGENEILKDSEDLINIINIIKKTSNTNAEGIPETELLKLRNVLEGNEYSIRDEMGMYLRDGDSHFQSAMNTQEKKSRKNDVANDYFAKYAGALTPPKSVSPVQENLSYNSNSPDAESLSSNDYNEVGTDEHLIDILKGIDEISPEELNIYLDEGKNACDLSNAKRTIQERCKPNNLDHALRRLSSISAKYLCKKDDDGDTCLMIVYSKPEDNPDFYENIFCLQEKVREIRVCCDTPLGKAKRCKVCGNMESSKFYTPLSFKNKQGDTALSCAVKTNHSTEIINYLLHGILQCPEDFRRVFDEKGRAMLSEIGYKYPSLRQYL